MELQDQKTGKFQFSRLSKTILHKFLLLPRLWLGKLDANVFQAIKNPGGGDMYMGQYPALR